MVGFPWQPYRALLRTPLPVSSTAKLVYNYISLSWIVLKSNKSPRRRRRKKKKKLLLPSAHTSLSNTLTSLFILLVLSVSSFHVNRMSSFNSENGRMEAEGVTVLWIVWTSRRRHPRISSSLRAGRRIKRGLKSDPCFGYLTPSICPPSFRHYCRTA